MKDLIDAVLDDPDIHESHKTLVKLRFARSLTQAETALEMGVSEEDVAEMESSFLRSIRSGSRLTN